MQIQIEYVYLTPMKVIFKGWASGKQAISSILFKVSGQKYQLKYGLLRPDIASRYGVPEDVGFSSIIKHENLRENSFKNVQVEVNFINSDTISFKRNFIPIIKETTYTPSIKGLEKSHYAFDKSRKADTKQTVDILIPFKNDKELLEKLIDSIVKNSGNFDYKIYLLDNASNDIETQNYVESLKNHNILDATHVICDYPFNFSKMINDGIRSSSGNLILLLNNDIEVITQNWLELFAGNFRDTKVAVVGAKLLYPDHTVQHTGIALGHRILTKHIWKHFPNSTDQSHHMNQKRLTSAVTGAAMMIRRNDLKMTDLFDENLAVTLNDIDFCLRVLSMNKIVLYDPDIVLIHHESFSRGASDHLENFERTIQEVRYFKKRWNQYLLKGDPFV